MSDQRTSRVLARMMRENTGTHFLDSGGEGGRNWEKNQKKRFANAPSATLDASFGELSIRLNLYQWLKDRVIYAPKLDKQFQEFAKQESYKDKDFGWLEIMESFASLPGHGFRGTCNSYNGEDWLSQVIQYTSFYSEKEKQSFILLQIHGGCDVRGGYTKPHVFRVEEDGFCLSDNAQANVFCSGEKVHGWTIAPGYSQSFWDGPGLETFQTKELQPKEKPVAGFVCYRESGEGYCPICASQLKAEAQESGW